MRLSHATLDGLPAVVARPGYDVAAQRCGIVHLGVGAFHRAHQAVYTDAAMSAGDRDWAITGVSLRSPQVRDQLVPQDSFYTVHARDGGADDSRLIGAVRDVIVAPEAPGRVRAALAAPEVSIVTLTVTEKGYHRSADGALDVDAADAAGGTIYHHLARAMGDRHAAGLPGLTIVSCDNLPDNGGFLSRALTAWLDRHAPAEAAWFAAECTCPATMVDRIVPAATDADRDRIAALLGMRDEGALVTEPFTQWVIEDRFAGPRPRWEVAGAEFVRDVAPYETAKLRMLNGAHSALAYLGLLAGRAHVHEALAVPAIRATVERLMRDEAAAGLDAGPGQDLAAYADLLLARFANPALPHRLAQIATDGSQKIGQRWLASLADNAARGRSCPATLRALAAWLLHVRGDGAPVNDPRAAELAETWTRAGSGGIVAALFGEGGLMPSRWHPTEADRATLTRDIAALDRTGTTSAA